MSSATKPLVARTLVRPVNRELPVSLARHAEELEAARAALLDRRDESDRVMDAVVDRMLKELSW